MLFEIAEIIDLVIMVVAIGYIFSTFVKRRPMEGYDPLTYYKKNTLVQDITFGAAVAAPAVVFHELAHKFSALAMGAPYATLEAPIGWYIAIIIMRLLNFPLLFFVGGYVVYPVNTVSNMGSAFIAVSGPLTNLIMYGIIFMIMKFKLVDKKYFEILSMSGKINLLLAAFNMIPLPGFDGYHFINSLIKAFTQG